MNIRKTLGEARRLINERGNWTQNAMARDKNSKPVSEDDPKAIRWCLTGALRKTTEGDCLLTCYSLLKRTMKTSIASFNDNHTHKEVLKALDEAIDQCPK